MGTHNKPISIDDVHIARFLRSYSNNKSASKLVDYNKLSYLKLMF